MGRNHKFNQCCTQCGDLLTTANTNRSLIKDKRYICYNCIDERLGDPMIPDINSLAEIYDFDNAKAHKKIDRQSNKHSGLLDRLMQPIIEPPSKNYPTPKGQAFLINLKEIKCPSCNIILTTTNTSKTKIKHQYYNCNLCQKNLEKARETDPLYEHKKKIKSLLLALHNRRKVRQFTWEYVEQRFATPAQPVPIIYEQEDYDMVSNLFGAAYAEKAFHTAPIEKQQSFGDLSTEEGCQKLLNLFQWELDKSKNVGRRRQQQYAATAWSTAHDPRYQVATPSNSLAMDDVVVMDISYLAYYGGHQCEPKRHCTFEEIKLSDEKMPDVLEANESQLKTIEIKRQQTILALLTEPAEIIRQQWTIVRLYEDLRGHWNMNWTKFCDNKRFLDYETPEEFT